MTESRWKINDPQWLLERQNSWGRIKRSLEISEQFTKKQLATYENYYLKGKVPKWNPQSEGSLVDDVLWTDEYEDPIPLLFRLWFDPDQSLENWESIRREVLSYRHWLCVEFSLRKTFDFFSEANNHTSYSGHFSTPDGFMGGLEERMVLFLKGKPEDGDFIEYHGRKIDKRMAFHRGYYFDFNQWLSAGKICNRYKSNIYLLEYWYFRLSDEVCEKIKIGSPNKTPTDLELFNKYLIFVAHYGAPDLGGDDFVRQEYCQKVRNILDERPLPNLMMEWWQKAKASPVKKNHSRTSTDRGATKKDKALKLMTPESLIEEIRDDDKHSETIRPSEKKLIDSITDYAIFTTKYEISGEIPLAYVFGGSSYEFIHHVMKNLGKVPQSKKLLSYAMHLDKGSDRPCKAIQIAREYGYKVTKDVATTLLQNLCQSVAEKEASPLDSVRSLISLGADVNAADSRGKGYTPLMYSFWSMSPETTAALLEHGADPNFVNLKGESALLVACGKPPGGGISLPENEPRLAVLKLLLEAGANPNYGPTQAQDAMYWAKRTKRPQSIALLSTYYKTSDRTISSPISTKVSAQALKKQKSWDKCLDSKTLKKLDGLHPNDLRVQFLIEEPFESEYRGNLYAFWDHGGEELHFARENSLGSKYGAVCVSAIGVESSSDKDADNSDDASGYLVQLITFGESPESTVVKIDDKDTLKLILHKLFARHLKKK